MKKLMLGNEAVARGLYEAGCTVVSSYPGTPSTEITECAAGFDEIYCEWAPNEKVAFEVTIGASIGGARAFSACKHVGLNVAADPLFTVSYTGVNGGLVFAVADDPGMHSSQNEQDSRHYAIAAKVPMLEPSDSAECLEYTKKAFDLSEKTDSPVLLRLSTRISHSRTLVKTGERQQRALREYVKDPAKYVMMPANARPRRLAVEKRMEELSAIAETDAFNTVYRNGSKIGVITSGIAYQHAKQALGDRASFLKLGLINPLPVRLIREFAESVKTLYVIEELDGIIETHCKSLGVACAGKELFGGIGELTAGVIAEKILGEKTPSVTYGGPLPARPPVLCAGCPHRATFYTLSKLKLMVYGDIGCYTLSAMPPLSAMDATICMGASVSGLHGFTKARGGDKKAVAVIGDSTFVHSGITGLIDIAYNKSPSTVIILDNSITGMTGHQHNPATGYNIKGEPAPAVDIEALCRAVGINRVTAADPYELDKFEQIVRRELDASEPSVIIAKRPCALLKSVKRRPPLKVNDKCAGCGVCMRIGCPAMAKNGGRVEIDETLCVGCGLCQRLCRLGAIGGGDND